MPLSPRLGVEFSQAAAAAVARLWMDRLGLLDWTAEVVVRPPVKRNRWCGTSRIVAERKWLKITVTSPHVGVDDVPEDAEDTILHEILHVFFEPWRPADERRDRARHLALEQAIVALAAALLALDRGRR